MPGWRVREKRGRSENKVEDEKEEKKGSTFERNWVDRKKRNPSILTVLWMTFLDVSEGEE